MKTKCGTYEYRITCDRDGQHIAWRRCEPGFAWRFEENPAGLPASLAKDIESSQDAWLLDEFFGKTPPDESPHPQVGFPWSEL